MRRLVILGIAILAVGLSACSSDDANDVVGAYKTVEVDEEAVIEAAQFAVQTESANASQSLTLHHVLKAYEQVVAGLNYRLILQVRDGSISRLAEAVVYRDLEGQLSLTSWDWQ
ncbi:MAG: cystatin domain-containing protein [Pseudomonadota bacterium]